MTLYPHAPTTTPEEPACSTTHHFHSVIFADAFVSKPVEIKTQSCQLLLGKLWYLYGNRYTDRYSSNDKPSEITLQFSMLRLVCLAALILMIWRIVQKEYFGSALSFVVLVHHVLMCVVFASDLQIVIQYSWMYSSDVPGHLVRVSAFPAYWILS